MQASYSGSLTMKGMVTRMKKPPLQKVVAAILALQFSLCSFTYSSTALTGSSVSSNEKSNELMFNSSKGSYASYLSQISNFPTAKKEIELDANRTESKSGNAALIKGYLGDSGESLVLEQGEYAEWMFTVPQTAVYEVEVQFSSYQGKSGAIVAGIYIDGSLPFVSAGSLTFNKVWKNGKISQDLLGNDIEDSPEEVPQWQTVTLEDPSSDSTQPMRIALKSGERKLRLGVTEDNMAVSCIRLKPISNGIDYSQYAASAGGREDDSAASGILTYEAENSSSCSDNMITPINDPSSPFTSPQKAGAIKLNEIGGTKWETVGQEISWKISVPNSGYYQIGFRARQNTKNGIFVTRELKINGAVPFKEAESIQFPYASDWYNETVQANRDNCEFYFEKGKTYTITMQVSLGDVGKILSEMNSIISNLNQSYLNILMIVGASPDPYRDYGFEKLLPNTMSLLKEQKKQLDQVIAETEKMTSKGEFTSLLRTVSFQLNKMVTKPSSIASEFTAFKTNIGALGTWVSDAKLQPLELDQIYVVPKKTVLPKARKNFFQSTVFATECFLKSFVIDYSKLSQSAGSTKYQKSIKVWVSTGRDQAQILTHLSDEMFSTKYKIKVDLELVGAGTLLPSVLAGVGPDVSLMNGQSDPMNYAIRSAVYDLDKFSDLNSELQNFEPNAVVPFQYGGHTYALPETLSFPMFFYRKDIFEELGLSVPKTWNDLIKLVPQLQQYNMEVGFPTSLAGYTLMLYQKGIPLYLNNGKSSNFGSDAALQTFNELCQIFTVYRAPVQYDFVNRFRTGEMPCGIQDYTTVYNQLILYAPELNGLWDFVPVPGVTVNGKFRNISIATSTGSMIMTSTKDPDSSWQFIKWWLSAEVQSKFATSLQSVLGPASKYPTANKKAFDEMTWTVSQKDNILAQMKDVMGVPEVPGDYYTGRIVDFAFNDVYNQGLDPIETLTDYIPQLNDELTRKRAEFGIH